MAIRFRKSIKLAPGIRWNISGGGSSFTFGLRGASIGIGKRGTYLSTGIPGSGLYLRSKLLPGGHAAPSRPALAASGAKVRMTCGVNDDGSLYLEHKRWGPAVPGGISPTDHRARTRRQDASGAVARVRPDRTEHSSWIAQDARDRGKPQPGKEGLTTAEREELVRLRRQVRQLQTERDILAKATAWFAGSTSGCGVRPARAPWPTWC